MNAPKSVENIIQKMREILFDKRNINEQDIYINLIKKMFEKQYISN
jgi:hypothetical protein